MVYEDIKIVHADIIQEATSIMKNIEDPVHGVSHMMDVVNYTNELINFVDAENPINLEVCIIAAYWHDVGRIRCDDGHAELSACMMADALSKYGYSSNFIEACYNAICNHSSKAGKIPTTLEGILVRDADKIASAGKERWLNCIESSHDMTLVFKSLYDVREKKLILHESKNLFDQKIIELVETLYYLLMK